MADGHHFQNQKIAIFPQPFGRFSRSFSQWRTFWPPDLNGSLQNSDNARPVETKKCCHLFTDRRARFCPETGFGCLCNTGVVSSAKYTIDRPDDCCSVGPIAVARLIYDAQGVEFTGSQPPTSQARVYPGFSFGEGGAEFHSFIHSFIHLRTQHSS